MHTSPISSTSPPLPPAAKKYRTIFGLASGFDRSIEPNYFLLKRKTPKLSQLSYFDEFDTQSIRDMAIDVPAEHPSPTTLHPARIPTDDGSWIVRAAETPNDASSFTIYVKTPTHHLTLTRTIKEISDLHAKLHEAYPTNALPPLPELIRTASAKRRGSFLQTLSRFGSHKEKNHSSAARSSNSATQNLGLITPTQEPHEPPTDMESHGNVGALPDYLTTLANHPTLRTSRPWKRFVHVRADDLQSTRVERQIRRVRSDLAAHTTRLDSIPHLPPILTDSLMDPFVTQEADHASTKLATPLKETPIVEVDEEAAPVITLPDTQNALLGEEHRDSASVREVTLLSPEAEGTVQSLLQVDVEIADTDFVAPASPLGLPKEPFASSEEQEGTPATPHQTTVSMPSQPTQPSQPQGHTRTVRSASADPTHRLSASAGGS